MLLVGGGFIAARIVLPGLFMPDAQAAESTAKYYPVDTLAYGWLSLSPAGEQAEHIRAFIESLEAHPGFQDFRNDLNGELDGDVLDEMQGWIGPDVSIGILDMEPDILNPSMDVALTVSVRDREAASTQIAKLVARGQRAEVQFLEFDVGDFYVWADLNGESSAFALSDELFIMASSSESLHRVLSRASGLADNEGNLTLRPEFAAGQSQYKPERFASLFVNSRLIYERALASQFPSEAERDAMSNFVGDSAPWTAASFVWHDKGIEGEWVYPYTENALNAALDPSPLTPNYAQLVPHDAALALGWGYDSSLDNLRKGLASFQIGDLLGAAPAAMPAMLDSPPAAPSELEEGTLADVLDFGLSMGSLMLGIDLQADLFDHLSGQLIVSAGNLPDVEHLDDISLGLSASHTDGSGPTVENTLWTLMGASSSFGETDISFAAMGDGENAIVSESFDAALLVADGWITGSTSLEWLGNLTLTRRGQAPSLATRAEYLRAADGLAPAKHLEVFVDLKKVLRNEDEGGASVLGDIFGVLLVRDGGDSQFSRLVTVLTLTPVETEGSAEPEKQQEETEQDTGGSDDLEDGTSTDGGVTEDELTETSEVEGSVEQ